MSGFRCFTAPHGRDIDRAKHHTTSLRPETLQLSRRDSLTILQRNLRIHHGDLRCRSVKSNITCKAGQHAAEGPMMTMRLYNQAYLRDAQLFRGF